MMMKKIAITFGLLFSAFSAPATASDAQYGYITTIYGTSNGAVLFHTSGARGTPPACQGPGLAQRFAINASTLVGQSQLSVLLMAYAQNKRIWIHGLGTCNIWGDTETVDFFNIED